MKLVTLKQVEDFLRENPRERLQVGPDAYFCNVNFWVSNDEKVDEAGSDIRFVYGDTELRRFSQGHGMDFQATDFLHNANEAMAVVKAFFALERVFSTPYVSERAEA